MHLDEVKIHGLLLKGSPSALEQIIAAYGACVYQLVSLILQGRGDSTTVEECCSDVFVRVWEKRKQYNPQRGSLRTWVLILARYRAIDYRRKLCRRQEKEVCGFNPQAAVVDRTNAAPGYDNDPESCYLREERRAETMAALAALNEADREILYRRYFLEETVDQIASHLNISRGAADNRLWRARKALKRVLTKTRQERAVTR